MAGCWPHASRLNYRVHANVHISHSIDHMFFEKVCIEDEHAGLVRTGTQ